MLSRNLERTDSTHYPEPGQPVQAFIGDLREVDLFAEFYDETVTVFNHATIGDLQRTDEPFVILNGTDVTTGARFSFTQDPFDVICGDLSQVTLGRAVATSHRSHSTP